jgi:hypothetical protein
MIFLTLFASLLVGGCFSNLFNVIEMFHEWKNAS